MKKYVHYIKEIAKGTCVKIKMAEAFYKFLMGKQVTWPSAVELNGEMPSKFDAEAIST